MNTKGISAISGLLISPTHNVMLQFQHKRINQCFSQVFRTCWWRGTTLIPSSCTTSRNAAALGGTTSSAPFHVMMAHSTRTPGRIWMTHGPNHSNFSHCGRSATTLGSELHSILPGQACCAQHCGYPASLDCAYSSMACTRGEAAPGFSFCSFVYYVYLNGLWVLVFRNAAVHCLWTVLSCFHSSLSERKQFV